MNKLFVFIFLVITSVSVFAQQSEGGILPSLQYNIKYNQAKIIDLPGLDLRSIKEEDAEDGKNGTPLKYAKSLFVNLSIENSGYWTKLSDGSRLWQLQIHSEGAKALGIYYDKFFIPEGGKLFLCNGNKKQVIGAFTELNNRGSGNFANELIEGDVVTLEYYEPVGTTTLPEVSINEIAYAFRNVNFLNLYSDKEFGDSDVCQVNINCSPEGDNWQDEKKGVARISIKISGSYYWCSGSLINNTSQDCYPYFLTANHCTDGFTDADLLNWIFYFHYEAPSCANPTSQPTTYKTVTGCYHVSHATGSDFFLLYLETYIPSSWDVYYNGWNRSTTATTGGVGIHHPAGDIKKISTFTGTTISSTWTTGATGAHWRLTWAATTNGHGVTEGGSSGSPLFDNNGRIIGDLTGGGSYCTATTQADYYGKFSYSWQSNGSTADKQVKPWLDPTNTGVTTLDGMAHTCPDYLPVANFSASDTIVYKGSTVTFTDLSTGMPNWWKWDCTGATPSVAFSQNKTVTYNMPGQFNVRLIAKNLNGGDTLLREKYITVLDTAELIPDFTADTTKVLVGGAINFSDISHGTPFEWIWEFEGGTPSVSTLENPQNILYSTPGLYKVKLTVSDIVHDTSLTKLAYITVIDTVPVNGNFASDQQCIMINNTAAFSISGSAPIIYNWTFEGGNPSISSLIAPVVTYDTAGIYDVELIVSNGFDIDTILKTDYIHVIDNSVLLNADFSASLVQIDQGESIEYTDLSSGQIEDWIWEFYGGVPATSVVTSPGLILYPDHGIFDVRLIVSNCYNADTLLKSGYITVKDTSSGIDNITNLDYFVYPNPASNKLFVKNLSGAKIKIQLIDILGNVVYSDLVRDEKYFIDIANVNQGSYIFIIDNFTRKYYYNIIIEK